MRKSVLIPIVILSVVILASLGFSGVHPNDENLFPVEKGKTYKVMALDRTLEMKVLEKPKGNWVKVKITKRDVWDGIKYINLNQAELIKEIEGD